MTDQPDTSRLTDPGHDRHVVCLHQPPYNLTHHQTTPLTNAGVVSVAALLDLVAAHERHPDGSRLSGLPGIGGTRLDKIVTAARLWRTNHTPDSTPDSTGA